MLPALVDLVSTSQKWLLLTFMVSQTCGHMPALACKNAHSAGSAPEAEEYFWNEITGELQWEDPGDVPHEDPMTGQRYWLSAAGERQLEDPRMFAYAWVEQFSTELNRHYYYNQETRETTWERPVDLGWRRVRVRR